MCEIDEIKELLVKMEVEHEKGISKKPNLFSILDISNREVLICRFIAYLLNPKGNHGMETVPLEEFLKETEKNRTDYSVEELKNAEILKQIEEKRKKYKKEELESAEIVLEEKIENDRRVDIVIYIGNDIYPIEVKIWAKDQQAQLSDYYNFYFKEKNKESIIFYLTPDGHEPSDDSRGGLKDEQIKCLSFNKHILDWISALKELEKNERMDYILEEFEEVIKQMCAEYEEKEILRKKMKELMGESQYLESLLVILKHSEYLWNEIRDECIREALQSESNDYELVPRKEIENVLDKNCIYGIRSNGDLIAYICVETNLYIACKSVKEEYKEKWKKEGEYFWRHIGPDNKKINLKDPNPNIISMKGKINIAEILKEIDIK